MTVIVELEHHQVINTSRSHDIIVGVEVEVGFGNVVEVEVGNVVKVEVGDVQRNKIGDLHAAVIDRIVINEK